ncbi:dihydroorotate dehydrogenase electron transfer subunit [Candidatus Woesearchaeota archaeon]|nr:dihydroorotate dehydrogenase electron transfer subunit [Candidatus Woesearchaeota archaeon]
MTEQPIMLEIEKIVDEAKDFKTFIFRHNLYAEPGQFIMAWLPGIDEKPFSVSFQDNERFGITIFKIGKFTENLFKLKDGDKLGIRGPYGNGFTLKKGNIVLVGGGCGSAPMGFLADELKKFNSKINFIIGAKCKESLLFLDRMNHSNIKITIATDDGSYGFKGFTTEVLENILKKRQIDMVYTCGPEIMMKFVVQICDKYNVPCELSLERFMKCGIGVCGQCCMDNSGVIVCKDGPVFSGKVVKQLKEFGNYKRAKSGKKVKL